MSVQEVFDELRVRYQACKDSKTGQFRVSKELKADILEAKNQSGYTNKRFAELLGIKHENTFSIWKKELSHKKRAIVKDYKRPKPTKTLYELSQDPFIQKLKDRCLEIEAGNSDVSESFIKEVVRIYKNTGLNVLDFSKLIGVKNTTVFNDWIRRYKDDQEMIKKDEIIRTIVEKAEELEYEEVISAFEEIKAKQIRKLMQKKNKIENDLKKIKNLKLD